jgi:Rrf2 family transcriptional regulator, iron-sulfur cluster assembly transcription factor
MLSSSCKYGVRAVLLIASKPATEGKIGLKTIASELKIPQPFLAKILQILSKSKILNSAKGPHGGFSLMRPATEITLMDIVRAIDGDEFFDSCLLTGEKCNYYEPSRGVCLLHNDLRKEKVRLTRFFSSKSIDSLVRQLRKSSDVVL